MAWTASLQSHAPLYTSGNKIRLYRADFDNVYGPGVMVKQVLCSSEEEEERAEEEGRIPQSYPHPYICECRGCVKESTPDSKGYYVYTFWAPMPASLQNDIDRRASAEAMRYYTEEELWSLYRQLLEVFAYLQDNQIVHRDIKPDNIMRDVEGNVRIIDFGFAKKVVPNIPSVNTLLGTRPFMSPALRKTLLDHSTQEGGRVQHNMYKSDVYSLGMVLLNLSLLELPQFLTTLTSLQSNIDVCLDSLGKDYSEAWISLLRWMLRVEEQHRPDFLELRNHLNTQSLLEDDDYLIESAPVAQLTEPLEMRVKCGLKEVRVSAQQVDEVPCMVSVQAALQDPHQRIPIDLVCVIDQSGSMLDDNTLDFVKVALRGIVERLGEQDRFSLVGFSDTAERKCPLIRCTPQGKERITAVISQLQTLDLTNLTAGFLLGLRVLQDRKYPKQACSLLLFTDGQHNIGEAPSPICEETLRNSGLERFTVNCFGLGESIDSKLLGELADISGGQYYHLSTDQIERVFEVVVGSISSVVGRNLQIRLEELESTVPCRITKVYSEDGTNVFTWPSIAMNERKDFIFLLKPQYMTLTTKERVPTVIAKLTFTDNEGTLSYQEAIFDINFVKSGISSPQNYEVYVNWYRVRGTDCLHQLQKAKDYLQIGIDALSSSLYATDEQVSPIMLELKKVKECLQREL